MRLNTTRLNYDLLNKFIYTNSKKLPKLQKASINFSCKNNLHQNLATTLLAIELISKQKGMLTKAKKPNLTYKIRENSPTGCKVTLRKQNLYELVSRFTNKVFPNIKNFMGISLKKHIKNCISYELNNVLIFPEIEKNFGHFKNLSKLQATFVFKCQDIKELEFLVQFFRFVIKKSTKAIKIG
jgi:large subunit ribosomal protein L5